MGRRDGVPASTIPLLQTKLFPPGAGGLPLLPRQALIDRLYEARARRAMVLSAPAGFGKSTILCQLRLRLLEQGAAVAWLSCDETDSEPQRLIQYLLASIQRVVPAFGGNTANLLGTDVAVPLEGILDAFLADLRRLEGPLYLFLDDFHRIRHAALPHGVRYLVENLPDHVRVVASTRFRPRFLVDEPTLKPWTFCLSAEDLRLSREESDAFLLDLKGLELGERELKLLFKRTEGWITALHLAALALSRNTDREGFLRGLSGTERNIADYLAEDVLASLPADLQLFLDQTSVLDEFNAELCNALTGRRDGLDMLMRLQNEQLFVIALDDQREWFRYHHLFAEFLQGRLSRHADPTPLLHAAARWCEGRDLADRAIKYALRARDYLFAAELLERQGARLIAGNRVYGILGMLNGIPAEVIREHPVFQIFYAWQLAFEQRFAEAEALIEEVSHRLLQGRGKVMHFGLGELLAAAQVLKALVLLYQDKLEACLKVARHWLSMVPSNQPVFRASLLCVQASAHALLGDYAEAAGAIGSAREDLKVADSEYLQVVTSLIESLICKESGDLERGRAIAESARNRVEQVFGRRSRSRRALVAGLCRPALRAGPACRRARRTTAGDGLAGCRDAGGTAQSRPVGHGQGALLLRRRRAGVGATRRMAERSALARLRACLCSRHELQGAVPAVAAPSERSRACLPATGAASCRALRRAACRRTDRPGPGGGSAGIVRASRGTRAEQAGKLSGRLLFRLPEGSAAAFVLVTFCGVLAER